MFDSFIGARELEFLFDLLLALIAGFMIGAERENKGKPAGISTQTLVISGSMMFAFMSDALGAGDPTRIAAQIVSGIGFLGAGIILKSEKTNKISNVTTAASIWYSAAIGMAFGFNLHVIGMMAAVYAVVISRIPRLNKKDD